METYARFHSDTMRALERACGRAHPHAVGPAGGGDGGGLGEGLGVRHQSATSPPVLGLGVRLLLVSEVGLRGRGMGFFGCLVADMVLVGMRTGRATFFFSTCRTAWTSRACFFEGLGGFDMGPPAAGGAAALSDPPGAAGVEEQTSWQAARARWRASCLREWRVHASHRGRPALAVVDGLERHAAEA